MKIIKVEKKTKRKPYIQNPPISYIMLKKPKFKLKLILDFKSHILK